jgi:hypothetical protein
VPFLADVLLKEGATDFVRAAAVRRPLGRVRQAVCDATGKPAKYTDPVSGLQFADPKALAMLREQMPSWVKATAISPYWDAVRTLLEE